MGSEGSGGGDDLGEVGLQRIGLHREAECNVDEISAAGAVLGDALDGPVRRSGERAARHRRRHLGAPLLLDAIEFGVRVRVHGAEVEGQIDRPLQRRLVAIDHLARGVESVFSHVLLMLLREALTFGLGQALVAGPLAPLPIIAQVGSRLTGESGADVPTTWTAAPT